MDSYDVISVGKANEQEITQISLTAVKVMLGKIKLAAS